MEYNSKAYALANVYDRRHVKEVMQFLSPRETDRILEVGCGRGFITKEVQNISPETHGIDVNPESITHGVALNLRVNSAYSLEFSDGRFDKVYSFHVIEHIPDTQKVLSEMERVLKPGGLLFLAYPAEPIHGLFSIPAATILFKNPLRTREIHVHSFTPKRLQEIAKSTGFIHRKSKFSLLSFPQYFTLFQKKV